jgi:hypothetical protein
MLMRAEGGCMFDVYLNEKRDRLLVVAKGQPIPTIGNSGRWRKKKGAVAVSDEIKPITSSRAGGLIGNRQRRF